MRNTKCYTSHIEHRTSRKNMNLNKELKFHEDAIARLVRLVQQDEEELLALEEVVHNEFGKIDEDVKKIESEIDRLI